MNPFILVGGAFAIFLFAVLAITAVIYLDGYIFSRCSHATRP
jgi:hypothetical protein